VRAKQEFTNLLRDRQRQLNKDLRLRITEIRQRFLRLASSYVFRQPVEIVHQYEQQVDDLRHRLIQATIAVFDAQHARLQTAGEKFKLLSPQSRVAGWRQQLAAADHRLAAQFAHRWQDTWHRLDALRGKLEVLSPKSTLERGYSITRRTD